MLSLYSTRLTTNSQPPLLTRRGVKYSHSLDYLRQGRNVIVLRTFSKVHGLAGARIGYGIASARLVESISRHRALYSVSSLAQAGALAALDDNAHVRKAIENNTAQSERLVAGPRRTRV